VLQPKIAKNSLKLPIFGVQGHRWWYRWKARRQCLLWYAASLCICNRFHARWSNYYISGKITISKGGTPLWCPRSRGLLAQRHQITSLETRNSRLTYGEDPESISPGLGILPGREGGTDGQTDRHRIPIANTRHSSAWRGTAVARKKSSLGLETKDVLRRKSWCWEVWEFHIFCNLLRLNILTVVNYRVAQNKIHQQTLCNFSATSCPITKILEAA